MPLITYSTDRLVPAMTKGGLSDPANKLTHSIDAISSNGQVMYARRAAVRATRVEAVGGHCYPYLLFCIIKLSV